jgi:predicted N-formylglutamate amidohydrolase
VTRRLSTRFDAAALLGGYSRLAIDLNRPLDDPTSVPAISEGVIIPGNRDVTASEREVRAEALFHPYHRAIAEALEGFRARGIVPALVSVHSFTPVFKGEMRPWHVGAMWDRDPRMAVPFMEKLAADSRTCVGDNLPYSGRDHYTYTADHHAARVGLPHLVMEIRADLLEGPAGAERWSTMIGDAMAEVLAVAGLHPVESSA